MLSKVGHAQHGFGDMNSAGDSQKDTAATDRRNDDAPAGVKDRFGDPGRIAASGFSQVQRNSASALADARHKQKSCPSPIGHASLLSGHHATKCSLNGDAETGWG